MSRICLSGVPSIDSLTSVQSVGRIEVSRGKGPMMEVHVSTRESSVEPYLSSLVAIILERTQISKYHTGGGHGFSAEDANASADRIRGRRVEVVGRDNAKNGADRIVNGVPIQTKYHRTPASTVQAGFDSKSGLYRYGGQVLEVPKDQYAECVAIMREKIANGRVPGVVDPKEAERLVQSGSITYKQARNIARAGNIDSVLFDIKTQAVTSFSIFAISFAVHFAKRQWNGGSTEDALKDALKSAGTAGLTTSVTGVLTAQILRTRAAAMGTVAARRGIQAVARKSTGKIAIQKLAQASTGKAIHGAAAVNHVAKLMRTNVISSAISTAVTSAPDLYRAAYSREASWHQFSKNLTVNAGGTAAGTVGWMGGATAGAALGSLVPGAGTAIGGIVGGLAGALAAGSLGTGATKRVLDLVIEDDAVRMSELLHNALGKLASDYLLSEGEIEKLMHIVEDTVDARWLRGMYRSGTSNHSDARRQAYAYDSFDKACLEIVKKRPRVTLPPIEMVVQEICSPDACSDVLYGEARGDPSLLPAA